MNNYLYLLAMLYILIKYQLFKVMMNTLILKTKCWIGGEEQNKHLDNQQAFLVLLKEKYKAIDFFK